MGFDLLLAGGSSNRIFSEALMGCLIEVRVEQSLSEPTKFAVRFLDDIEDGKLIKGSLPELAIGAIVTIAVRDAAGFGCLVRGPILRTKSEMTIGGPGSSYQIEGIDRRDELARDYKEGSWTGRASDVATMMLMPVFPLPDVTGTTEIHDPTGNPLPQRGSDLDFLKKNATENGFHFWVTYEDVTEVPGSRLLLREVAHWKESPALQSSPGLSVPPVIPLGKKDPVIKYNVPQDKCPNVTKFDLTRNGDRPNQVRAATQNTTDGGQDAATDSDAAAPVGGSGQRAVDTQVPRFMPPKPQGGAQPTRTINRAALREAGFFVQAEVATTRHLFGSVIEPHQVLGVEGVGGANGTVPFRVNNVTHVITSQAHFMQAKLATNAEVEV